MSELSSEKSQSIIETSLTELAFIFFFVLLAFSALKITEIAQEKKDSEVKAESLQKDRKELVQTLLPIQKAIANETTPPKLSSTRSIDESSLDEIFTGLDKTKKDTLAIIESFKTMERELSESGRSASEIAQALERVKELSSSKSGDRNLTDIISEIETRMMTLQGQNLNLRNKLNAVGNGLDHPPCWADPNTGEIQFVYEVTIAESEIKVAKSWPETRAKEVGSKPFIAEGLGAYSEPKDFWIATRSLYESSIDAECRHFVKVYDKASSKDAFKRYLLTIERHFYKLLL
jgi:hypothetical protein|tara:strand:+ start:29219 stop:30088 length:870 start_codon:yes stop_codon:yes gene_type:complete